MFTVTVLANGSKGNATLISSPGTKFLIDCGLSRRELRRRLLLAGCEPAILDAVVITHLHSDHVCSGAIDLCREAEVPLYVHEENERPLLERFRRLRSRSGREFVASFRFAQFRIGDCTLRPFPVPHDSPVNTCGLTVEASGKGGQGRFAYATDLGYFPTPLEESFEECDAVMLEFNHDAGALWNCDRPLAVKTRIAGEGGHLSNEQAASALKGILCNGGTSVRTVIVAHMSRECNSDELVMAELHKKIGPDRLDDFRFVFARQEELTPCVTVGRSGKSHDC